MLPTEFLHTHRVFTREEMAAELGVPTERAPATLDTYLGRWRRSGRLRRLKRGLYLRVDPADSSVQVRVDPYSLAGRVAPDAVLAFHTALELHGFAQSVFERFYFCTRTKVRTLEFAGWSFVPVRARAGYAQEPLAGVVTMDRPDGAVRVTTRERTILDVLDRPELGGGAEETWRSLTSIEVVDLRELELLTQRVVRPVLAARLGFVLETMQVAWRVPEELLDRLAAHRPLGPVYFERGVEGRLASRWNLVVPGEWRRSRADELHDQI